LDEIFGKENFVANIIWQKSYAPRNDARFFSVDQDYILVYAKDIERFKINRLTRTEKQNKAYKNPDNDPRGP
jgi:adenine-specific DNA-methyltransferase